MSKTKKQKSGKGGWLLVVFALPFAGVGVFMTGVLARNVISAVVMSKWAETEAVITQVELKSHRGDDSTTYSVKARYRYEYGGKVYTGNRVSLYGGSDNIGSFHQRVYAELKQKKERREPAPCYVNPKRPERSILYRDLRLEMVGFSTLFAVVFGGIGFGLLIGGWRAGRTLSVQKQLKAQHPDQPWLWKEEWADGRVVSSSKVGMIVAIGFALLWNLVSAPVVFIVPGEVMKNGNKLALLGLVFPLVGVGLAIWAVRSVLRWKKYGKSVFEMASVPGVIGGPLSGAIHVPVHIQPEDGFHVTLSCIRKTTSGSGKNRHTSSDVIWQDQRLIKRELLASDRSRSMIPVLFGIPFDARPYSDENSDNQTLWQLAVKARVPGIDYAEQFDVPVFRTPASAKDFVLDERGMAPYVAERSVGDVLARAGVKEEEGVSGTSIIFPAARHLGSAIGLTLFCIIWTAAIVFMIARQAPLIFPIVFGFFEIFVVYGTLDLWLFRSRLSVMHGRLSVRSGLLGIGRTRTYDRRDVRSITARQGMQSGSTLFYNIQLKDRQGKACTLGKRIVGKQDADRVAARIKDLLES